MALLIDKVVKATPSEPLPELALEGLSFTIHNHQVLVCIHLIWSPAWASPLYTMRWLPTHI